MFPFKCFISVYIVFSQFSYFFPQSNVNSQKMPTAEKKSKNQKIDIEKKLKKKSPSAYAKCRTLHTLPTIAIEMFLSHKSLLNLKFSPEQANISFPDIQKR